MKTFISCIALLVFHGLLFAQSAPTGLWEGYITVGGLDSDVGYKFELQLEGNGKRLKGRSYIQMGDQKVIMDVAGKMNWCPPCSVHGGLIMQWTRFLMSQRWCVPRTRLSTRSIAPTAP